MIMVDMGIGELGNPRTIIKRKFRWTLEFDADNFYVPPSFVKLASRPNINIEETEINYLNAKTWIPGKATWETINVTYYDVAGSENVDLWSWLATVYNFLDRGNNPTQASMRSDYAAIGTLKLYDGCGKDLETWTLEDCWPQAVNFGGLDMASSDDVNIEVTLRYSNAIFKNNCGTDPTSYCSPCSG